MLGGIIERVNDYFKLKAEQIKLEVMARVARLLGHVAVLAAIAFLSLFTVLFLSFALANYLNELLESSHLGYLILGGFYFLIMIIIALLAKRGTIQGWIEKMILAADNELNEEEDED